MPFRTRATLQSWVEEFNRQEHAGYHSVRVLPQDGAEGADTGLIAVRIPDSPTEIVIEPPSSTTGSEWSITFEPREQSVTLGATAVARIAEEVAMLAELCTFLQKKSDEFLADLKVS